jgi:hypothetical protein
MCKRNFKNLKIPAENKKNWDCALGKEPNEILELKNKKDVFKNYKNVSEKP